MKAISFSFCLALAASLALAQDQPAKTYKWVHPWFKKEFTSPTPPTWPYRVLSEKGNVVTVEVTPPGTGWAATKKKEPPAATAEPIKSVVAPGSGEAEISEAGFGKAWPFTVPSGVLRCKLLGELHLVTFSVGNVTYAVNGTARGRLKEYGFRDSDEIWKREPGAPEMRVSSTIVRDGLTLCGTSTTTKPLDLPASPKDEKIRNACAAVGNLAKHVANAKHKGAPRSVTSVMLAAATPKDAPDEIKSVFGDVVDFVYKTKLTPEDTEVAIIAACHLKFGLP